MSNSATIILRHELPILKENKQPKLISEIDKKVLKQIILEELQYAVINSDLLEEALKENKTLKESYQVSVRQAKERKINEQN